MMKTSMRRVAGFTLVELMIVVVIIAILAALAMNSYRRYILRGHRTDATRALQDLSAREENYYFSNNAYTNNLTKLGSGSDAAGIYFNLAIPSASSIGYTVEADATGAQMQDAACLGFQLTREGLQIVSNGTGSVATCWQGQ